MNHVKVLLKRFHLKSHTRNFGQQSQKLESPRKTHYIYSVSETKGAFHLSELAGRTRHFQN